MADARLRELERRADFGDSEAIAALDEAGGIALRLAAGELDLRTVEAAAYLGNEAARVVMPRCSACGGAVTESPPKSGPRKGDARYMAACSACRPRLDAWARGLSSLAPLVRSVKCDRCIARGGRHGWWSLAEDGGGGAWVDCPCKGTGRRTVPVPLAVAVAVAVARVALRKWARSCSECSGSFCTYMECAHGACSHDGTGDGPSCPPCPSCPDDAPASMAINAVATYVLEPSERNRQTVQEATLALVPEDETWFRFARAIRLLIGFGVGVVAAPGQFAGFLTAAARVMGDGVNYLNGEPQDWIANPAAVRSAVLPVGRALVSRSYTMAQAIGAR